MKIFPVTYSTPIFTSHYEDDGIIGFDDSISQEKRNLIREHYDRWHMPYRSIYNSEHRKNDHELQLITDSWKQYHEIQKIDKDLNIYRGQTLVEKPTKLYYLKNKGVKTIIDLVDYGDTYKEEVNKIGLNYYCYNIYQNWWEKIDFDSKDIKKLVDFIKVIQQDNVYIGCQHGANDTDIAFIINDFFNPQLSGKVKTRIPSNDADFPFKLNMIYDAFTKEQKKALGWTKEFEQKLIKKLISI